MHSVSHEPELPPPVRPRKLKRIDREGEFVFHWPDVGVVRIGVRKIHTAYEIVYAVDIEGNTSWFSSAYRMSEG
jgi:hypothetical protein